MIKDSEAFFQAGTQQYGAAVRAVCEFEALLEPELQEALRRIPSTSSIYLGEEPNFTRGKPPSAYVVNNGEVWLWAYANVAAKAPEKSTRFVELGVRWLPQPEGPNRVVASAGTRNANISEQLAKPSDFGGGVEKVGRGSRLTMDVGPNDSLVDALAVLVKALVAAAG